ncbi:MAG: putative ABC exporter domain-containing protein [Armatimonadota bacterium]|nr:putative ABC exporter domain-containing protein [bacterium]
MKPLIYLEIRQIINSIKYATRSPKRLIPLLLMGAWICSWLIQGTAFVSGDIKPRHTDLGLIQHLPVETIEAIIFIVLSIGSMMVMYNAFSSGTMVFSLAHIDFLFPTPVSRRHVLLLQLFKDYIKYGFYVTFLFLVIGAPMYSGLGVALFPWGLLSITAVTALLLTVVNLSHTIYIVFTFGFERLRQAGILIKIALGIGPVTAVGFGIYQYIQTGSSYASILWATNSPVVSFVFAPARWCATLLLAPLLGVTAEEWFHFVCLWLLAGASFALLMSRRENIYEPSLGISTRFALRRQRMRFGDFAGARVDALKEKGTRHLGGLDIPPFGAGATALLWKSLVVRYRVSRSQVALMLIVPVLVIFVIKHTIADQITDMLPYAPAVLLYVVWLLSLTAPTEMRNELKQANILKSMPIAAWKVMLAQTVNSVIYLTAGVLVFSGAMWWIIPETRGPVLLSCIIGAPFLGFANISLTAIPGVLYPQNRDVAQNYISGLLSFFLVSLAVIPSVVLGVLCLIFFRTSYYTAALIISAANIAVGAAGVTISGLIFRRYDPTGD